MIDKSQIQYIDGEPYIHGSRFVVITIACAIARPKSPQGRIFDSSVVPLVKNHCAELGIALELAIAKYREPVYRFRIRRGFDAEPFSAFDLLPAADQERLNKIVNRIDAEIGMFEIMRAMGFNPTDLSGNPIPA